jgi:hypothetical protein
MPIYEYSSSPLYVEENQSIQFRYEAPGGFSEIVQVTINIGELTVFWIIETRIEDFEPDPFFFQNIEDVEVDTLFTFAETANGPNADPYTGLSTDAAALRQGEQVVTVTGLDTSTQAPLLVTSNVVDPNDYDYRLRIYDNGTSSYGSWGAWTKAVNVTVSNFDQIQLRLRSSAAPADKKDVSVSIGTGDAKWEITTGTIPINTPNPAPNFGSLNNQEINALVYSARPQILGLTTSATISVDGGAQVAVSNSNSTFTNTNGFDVLSNIVSGWGNNLTVSNGQYVQLRATTTTQTNFLKTYNVTVGDGAGISGWNVTTGNGIDTIPNSFVFNNLVEQVPGQVNIKSTASGSVSSGIALVAGLTPNTTVPVTLRSSDTTSQYSPRISINGGSSGTVSNINVENGDTIELVLNGSSDVFDFTIPGQGIASMGINVGNSIIPTWSVTNWTAPDTTPSFTPITQVINRTPGGNSVIGPIGLTDFNLPITLSATAPQSFNEFNFATGENIGNVLFSVNGGPAIVGPVTANPDPGGDPVFVTIIMQQPGNADLDPVLGLSNYGQTNITFGDASSFQLRSINYAVKPIPPAYKSVWYSNKNESFDEDGWIAAGEDPNNAASYYRAPKFDGYALGTILPVPKEAIATSGNNFGYGSIEDRFPGFLPCDGGSYAAADYPWLWNSIGNQYGGSAVYVSATKTYSGNFNVPDYRNVRLVGAGRVDSNRGSSAIVPVTSPGGTFEEPGSTGGWWFVDDVDVAGPDPEEQVIAPAGSTSGTESEYFTLGTPRTFGTELVTTDVPFLITGSVAATIGPVSSVTVQVPQHEHVLVTGKPEGDGGDPCIPWFTYAYYRTNVSESGSTGQNQDDDKDDAVDDGYWTSLLNWRDGFADFSSQVSKSDLGDAEDLLPGNGESTVSFGNYWGSPVSNLEALVPGTIAQHFSGSGTPSDAGVIDTEEGRGRIDSYQSIYGTLTHSHLLGQDPVLNPNLDYTFGNVNGAGLAYKQGLANFGLNTDVIFNQSEVQIELNEGIFTWNNSTKPIPTASLDPQRKVPVVTPFHKIKYIIKAY